MLLFLRFLLFLSFFCITWVKIGERGIDLPCRPWFSSDKTPAPCPLVHSHLLPSYHHISSEFSLIVFCLPPLPPLLSARPVHSGIVPLFIPCAVNERGAFLYWGLGADPVIVGCTVDDINNLVLHVQHSNPRRSFLCPVLSHGPSGYLPAHGLPVRWGQSQCWQQGILLAHLFASLVGVFSRPTSCCACACCPKRCPGRGTG